MKVLSDFLAMHGYGWYVWSAYGSVLCFFIVEWVVLLRRKIK